ncbi:MAG: hypothetical protein ACI8RT_000998 [Candidatus Azotimanducaceae bacterium]|jgi:uncharacterized protein YndB with AHSA1/START domain|tara:strand:+ start:8118 stop:8645 length:528 start_codon:yes stop_codon:yes gene_type:complete
MVEKRDFSVHISGNEGWLELADTGAITVNFQRAFKTTGDNLWNVLTNQKELQRWSPGFKFAPKLGGKYELWFEEEPSGPPHIQGEIEAFRAPNLLQLGSIIFRLEATADGCQLKFTDSLVFRDNLSKLAVALTVLAGWHRYLDLLEQALSQEFVEQNIAEPNYSAIAFAGRHLVT